MLRSSEVAAWLATQLPAETALIKAGPLSGLVEEPDRVVAVVREGGQPPTDEGVLYVVAFRVTVRGAQRDHDSAELLVDEIDDALLQAGMPRQIGTSKVLAIRASARPALQTIDTAERSVLQASYEVVLPH